MRVAMFHWGFPPIIGGVETHLTMLCPELVGRGHEVSLLTGSVDGGREDDCYHGVKIKRTPLMSLNWLYKRGFESLEDKVEEIFSTFLDDSEADVVHAHNMNYFSELHAGMLKRLAKERDLPLILTAHNVWDDSLFLKLSRDTGWDHIIAVSNFIRKELVGIGIADEKVTVIHHGIDVAKYATGDMQYLERCPQLEGKRFILHPARIGIAKGCDVSVKALGLIKKRFPDLILVFTGSKNIIDWGMYQQKDIAYILHLIKVLDLEGSIIIDAFSRDEMAGLFQAAELCLYPSSFDEPFGLALLESMAAGKPIIVTDTGGMPEIIQDGREGFIVRRRDFEAMAEKAIMLLENRGLRECMGREARRTAEDKYTREIMTDKTLRVYEKVLASR